MPGTKSFYDLSQEQRRDITDKLADSDRLYPHVDTLYLIDDFWEMYDISCPFGNHLEADRKLLHDLARNVVIFEDRLAAINRGAEVIRDQFREISKRSLPNKTLEKMGLRPKSGST